LFLDAENGDFRLRPGSPAPAVGFEPFDYGRAGVYGDPAWRSLAERASYAPAASPPAPPPVEHRDGFEWSREGAPPPGAFVGVEGRGDQVVVSGERAAAGRRSLKVVDAPGLEHVWNPHFAYRPDYTEGRLVERFALWVGPGADLYHEWRDWRETPYVVGPSLSISDGVLRAEGRDLMAMPEGQWVDFELSCALGTEADGTWRLKVTPPDGQAREFVRLRTVAPGFRAATWVGFSSTADTETSFYVDDIELRCEDGGS
jgi:hypothetical protein